MGVRDRKATATVGYMNNNVFATRGHEVAVNESVRKRFCAGRRSRNQDVPRPSWPCPFTGVTPVARRRPNAVRPYTRRENSCQTSKNLRYCSLKVLLEGLSEECARICPESGRKSSWEA
jgi:hypothetical protein